MARDTKLNLNSNRFKQCSTDIMNLSGCTQIYGILDIENGSTLTICDNIGAGKVLTSDASGVATWQPSTGGGDFTGVTSVANGLSIDSGDVVLGGIIDRNTCILLPNIGTSTGTTTLSIGDNTLDEANIYIENGDVGSISLTEGLNAIQIDSSGITIASCIQGAVYAADYSSVYVDRSLVDKAYVDGLISTATGETAAISGANGLTRVGDNLTLGGTLTGNTTICGYDGVSTRYDLGINGLNDFNVTANNCITITSLDTVISGNISLKPDGASEKLIISSLSAGTSSDNILVRDSLGVVKEISQSSLTGETGTVSASNGLTYDGTNVVLGGTLTGNTIICNPDDVFLNIGDWGDDSYFSVGGGNVDLSTNNGNTFMIFNPEDIGIRTCNMSIYLGGSGEEIWLRNFTSDVCAVFSGYSMQYDKDYETCFVPRSLVTKQYVDGLISTVTGETGTVSASNGLTYDGANVVLGGTLTGNTNITIPTGGTTCLNIGDPARTEANIYVESGGAGSVGFVEGDNGISVDSTGVTIASCIQGAVYAGDYENNFVDRSLVTKQYVDNAVPTGTTSIANFDVHTGDTTIHYTQAAITIAESQVTNLVTDLSDLNDGITGNTANIITNYNLITGKTSCVGTVTSVAALTLTTTGTDITSSVANGGTTPVITLCIPTASATNRGALSSSDWSSFNAKTTCTGTVTSVGTSAPLSGTVTSSGNLSITQANTTTDGYLSSTDWNTFNDKTTCVGTVTSVAALTLTTTGTDISSSVANGGTTPVITLCIPTASATNRGALSSTDWSTFNSKTTCVGTVTSVNGGTGLSGTITSSGTINFDANSLAVGGTLVATDHLVASNGTVSNKQLISSIPLGIFNNNLGWTTCTGTVTSVGTSAPLSGTVTGSGNLSITQSNTTTDGYLSSTDWNTFNNKTNCTGTVTSVAALTIATTGTDISSSVANGGTTPVITLCIPTASATNRGALSSSDWSSFNAKTTCVGTVTSVGTNVGLSGTITSSGNLSLDLPSLALGGTLVATDWLIADNGGTQNKQLISSIPLGIFNNNLGWTTCTGTVTSVGTSAPLSGTVTGSGNLSITQSNTTTDGYLSSTDWNTFNDKTTCVGTVTSVGTTAPLSGTVTGSGNLSITQANTSTDGYLSSTDWNTFNDKISLTDNSVTSTKLDGEFKTIVALGAGVNIDWSSGQTFTKTLTTDVTLTFSNLHVGVKFLETTGDYSITFPTGFTYVGGTRAVAGTTLYQIVTTNTSTPVGYYTILKDES